MTPETIKAIQRLIGTPADGVWGPKSQAALNAYQAVVVPAEDSNDTILMQELMRDEAFVSHAYRDSEGYLTIGIGRLIDERKGGGITLQEAQYLKRNDIARFKAELDQKAPWWRSLDPVRQRVMLNMTFNMGSGWIDTWPNTIAMIRSKNWEGAAQAMLDSKWARQVKGRAIRLAQMMRTGKA